MIGTSATSSLPSGLYGAATITVSLNESSFVALSFGGQYITGGSRCGQVGQDLIITSKGEKQKTVKTGDFSMNTNFFTLLFRNYPTK